MGRKGGKEIIMAKFKLTKGQLEEAVSIYLCNNISAHNIGLMFGVSERPILKEINDLGLNKSRSEAQEKLRRISISEYKNIVEEYELTKNYMPIAAKYNVNHHTIAKILKKCGVKILSTTEKRLINTEDEKKIIERYLSGESTTSICKDYNTTHGGIGYYLKINGIEIKRRSCLNNLSQEDELNIINLYNEGILIQDITKKYKLHARILRSFLKEKGIKLRELGEPYVLENAKKKTRGISGYYKGHYFRSMAELCFIGQVLMVKYKDNEWRSGENKEDRIRYADDNGKNRWYYPDFIIKDKIIVECKPKNLFFLGDSPAKIKASKKYAKENKMKYILIDQRIDYQFIKRELESGNIQSTEEQLNRLNNQLAKKIK